MIETSRTRTLAGAEQAGAPDATKGMIFQIIQSSANDNLMPTMKWFTWLITWTIVVGGALAYAIF